MCTLVISFAVLCFKASNKLLFSNQFPYVGREILFISQFYNANQALYKSSDAFLLSLDKKKVSGREVKYRIDMHML